MCSTHCRAQKRDLRGPARAPRRRIQFRGAGEVRREPARAVGAPGAWRLERSAHSADGLTTPSPSETHTGSILALRHRLSLKKQTIARMHGQMRNRQSASNNRSNTALSYLILRSTSTSASHNMIRGFTSCVCGEVYLYLTLPYLTPLNL